MGAKRIHGSKLSALNIPCWEKPFVAAGCPLKQEYYQMS